MLVAAITVRLILPKLQSTTVTKKKRQINLPLFNQALRSSECSALESYSNTGGIDPAHGVVITRKSITAV